MIVFTGATLIDGTGAAPVADAALVIEGERIVAAGPRPSLSWPGDAEVDRRRAGRPSSPDSSTPTTTWPRMAMRLATRFGLDEPASTAHLRTARALADALGMGYTAIRDGGGLDTGFKLAIEQGLIPGPRLTLGLQILSPTGGIGDRVSPSGHSPASLGCCGGADPLLPRKSRMAPTRSAR